MKTAVTVIQVLCGLFLIAVVAVSVCIRIGVIPLPVSWGGK